MKITIYEKLNSIKLYLFYPYFPTFTKGKTGSFRTWCGRGNYDSPRYRRTCSHFQISDYHDHQFPF